MQENYQIKIVGEIGSYIDELGSEVKNFDLVDVMGQWNQIPAESKEVTVGIHSPGGNLDVARSIANFLKEKKGQGIKITTTTIPDVSGHGLVGSAATEIFGVGDVREIDPVLDTFFIHLPLFENLPNANSLKLNKALDMIKPQEDALLASYVALTGNSETALRELMAKQTEMSGQQAFDLKFANKLKNTKQTPRIVNKVMGNNMLKDMLAEIKAMLAPAVKALDLKLKSGQMVTSSAADMNTLEGSDTNAPDGDHELEDGSVITVAGGKITKYKKPAAQEPQSQYVTAAQLADFANEMKQFVGAIKALKESTDKELVEIKKQISSKHTPIKKKENANQEGSSEKSKEWDELMKTDGAVLALKKENPTKYKDLYFSKYGTEPNM